MVLSDKKLTDDELTDFFQRACVQLVPELTQQLLSLGVELAEYRTKIERGTLKEIPENAVVLTEDDLQNIKNARYCTGFINGKEQGIKETFEKIFEELYTWLNLEEMEKYRFVHIQKFDFLRKFRDLHKKLIGETK